MATTSETESKATPENERQMEEGTGQELPVGGAGAVIGDEDATAIFYKTKIVEFLGRSTQIVLQNDNGPCPLLAICNVLLLRNVVELSLDVSEVSQQKLLSLVAERLLDSNSNLEGKDEGYISNQQRNISDAIDLLPRLASGIDVNVLFRKINDFEFTRECAIFDLLDIGLYHGWIVDPQDVEAATAIGSKSYNALVGELVALDMKSLKEENSLPDEESVDFAAATTAALGVPSPSLSRSLSLSDPQFSSSGEYIGGRGDLEETEELMRVLNLSKGESFAPDTNLISETTNLRENVIPNVSSGIVSDEPTEAQLVTSVAESNTHESPVSEDNISCLSSAKVVELSIDHSSPNHVPESLVKCSKEDESMSQKCMPEESTAQVLGSVSNDGDDGSEPLTRLDSPVTDLNSLSGRQDVNESLSLNPNDVEPLYEGEECILDSAIYDYKNREPVYEGEAVLAMYTEQDNSFTNAGSKDTVSEHQWHLIKNFLKDNASQLTIYGLFCLQEGLGERELCVFFRNNHFSTMFKYKGELYLLATDQGYINQQNLVWEKLNEVNGDTMFVRSDFQPFMPEDEVNHIWNEKNGTKDFLALEGSTSANSTFKSDHELAKELQKQEFEKQPQRQQAPKVHQSSGPGSSRLIVGPQRSSRPTSNTSQKPDSKSKEKCVVM